MEYKFEDYNKIIIIENGEEKIVSTDELPIGLDVTSTPACKGNTVKIELPQNFSRSRINFQNVNNCTVEILSTINYINNLFIHLGESDNIKIKINRNCSVCSASIMSNQVNSEIEIGEDCMIASSVKIVGADGHTILDKNTGKVLNIQKHKCNIGNHVWLGDDCKIMKNAIIPDDSVVAAYSVVTKAYDEPNIILAGNPAQIVKRNITWSRDVITKIVE